MFSILAATKTRAPRDDGKPNITAIVDEEIREHNRKKNSPSSKSKKHQESTYDQEDGDSILQSYVEEHVHEIQRSDSSTKKVHELEVDDIFLEDEHHHEPKGKPKKHHKKLPPPAYANEDAYINQKPLGCCMIQ